MAPETFDQREKISLSVTAESSDVDSLDVVEECAGLPDEASGSHLSKDLNAAVSANFSQASDVGADVERGSTEGVRPVRAIPSIDSNYLPDFGGRFEVLERIGEGGMGVVYKVRDPALDKFFAVKILRSTLARDQQALKRFQREAEATIKLNHPGLVAVYEQGSLDDGTPYIVMDFVDGEDLGQVIESSGRMEPERAMQIFDQVMEALEHVHQSGLIHRDVKARNIILVKSEDGENRIKLVDFGIAKDAIPDAATIAGVTQTGDFLGSPLYMSPEQCQGAELESRSDIYSAGCVLYEMLTGKTPFASPNPVKIVVGHLSEKPASPSSMLSQTNPLLTELDFITLKCLEKNPEKRYQSAESIRSDLAACLGDRRPSKTRRIPLTLFIFPVFAICLVLAASVAPGGQMVTFLWYFLDLMRPYAPILFCVSLVVFSAYVALHRFRKINISNWFVANSMWMVLYLVLLPSFFLLPHVPLDALYSVPYFLLLAAVAGCAILHSLKYIALPKKSSLANIFLPLDSVLANQEGHVVRTGRIAWCCIMTSIMLSSKAPEFPLLVEIGPVANSILAMSLFLLLTNRFAKNRLSNEEKRKPGDRWLMLAGACAVVSAFGNVLSGVNSCMTNSFMVTVAQASQMSSLCTILICAPIVIGLVFLGVWSDRRNRLSPFGKSDGW